MTNDDKIWQTKLHARLHDPAEKALVLFRDPAGHEGGTSRILHSILFNEGIPKTARRFVKWADWWAAAADRPQLPKNASWTQIRWTKRPILIHPLTGNKIDLRSLVDTEISDVKGRSFTHFQRLIQRSDSDGDALGSVDWRKTLFAFWRFGPELGCGDVSDRGRIGLLWQHLPADTRSPDHSIWDHLDLTSAFAGAFEADGNHQAALLALSIGPVQSFIAAARSTSDLWAGSHLLARLSWEAMRVVCESIGPDAILFPKLRGIPQVDLWLRDTCRLPHEWFDDCAWTKGATDSNSLFAAGLPNRFVAIVPADAAVELAMKIERCLRIWLEELGGRVVDRLLEAGDFKKRDAPRDESVYAYRQMREQLKGFPEVHWASVPFSLAQPRNVRRQTDIDTSRLSEAMAPFFGADGAEPRGFLKSQAWAILQKEIRWDDGTVFYLPNPGVLYPAVYDLSERVLAAAKSVRPFEQTEQRGWRCSLTGETEWLTAHERQLTRPYSKQKHTLWYRVANRKPAMAKRGEHLGALPSIKRIWPRLFADEVGHALGRQVNRFVVSTDTMALADQIDKWLEQNGSVSDELFSAIDGCSFVALPPRIAGCHGTKQSYITARRIPTLLGIARESDDALRRQSVERMIKESLGIEDQIEKYYALILMDGDHMGLILSGDTAHAVTYAKSFHPDVRKGFEELAEDSPRISNFLDEKRAVSPNRHLAISSALSDFALHVVPHVIEKEHLGRVLYAGGDDVLAMLPVADLLSAMRRLRFAYSGADSNNEIGTWQDAIRRNKLSCRGGFALLNGRLMRMMDGATASCGAVVAHYQTPLGVVLRELRASEQRAKNYGRNRFSLTVMKRSGGRLSVTDEWEETLALLVDVRRFLSEPSVSRRAVYHTLVWLRDLPDQAPSDMLGSLIEYQFCRQTSDPGAMKRTNIRCLANRLAIRAVRQEGSRTPTSSRQHGSDTRLEWLRDFLGVAEFLAREVRRPPFRRVGAGQTEGGES